MCAKDIPTKRAEKHIVPHPPKDLKLPKLAFPKGINHIPWDPALFPNKVTPAWPIRVQ